MRQSGELASDGETKLQKSEHEAETRAANWQRKQNKANKYFQPKICTNTVSGAQPRGRHRRDVSNPGTPTPSHSSYLSRPPTRCSTRAAGLPSGRGSVPLSAHPYRRVALHGQTTGVTMLRISGASSLLRAGRVPRKTWAGGTVWRAGRRGRGRRSERLVDWTAARKGRSIFTPL